MGEKPGADQGLSPLARRNLHNPLVHDLCKRPISARAEEPLIHHSSFCWSGAYLRSRGGTLLGGV